MAPAVRSDMELHVVFYREDGEWYGHCLDFDLVESGASLDEARASIADVIRAHVESAIENDNLEHLFRSAPIAYWKRLWGGELLGVDQATIFVPDSDPTIPSAWKLQEVKADYASA